MMKRIIRFVLCALLLALLGLHCACAETVKVCGVEADSAATDIDLSEARQSLRGLKADLALLPALQTAQLGKTALSAAELWTLQQTYPNVMFSCELRMYGQLVPSDATELDAGDMPVRDVGKLVENLHCLPKLTRFTAYGTRLNKENIQLLTETFPQVDFHVTLNANGHWVATDATAFSTLHGETSTRHPDFSILAYCKQLRAIDIGHNSVRDLSFMAELPELRVLVLADNRISDLSPLAGLEHLEYIELFMNDVRDITPLGQLKNLLDVSLVSNQIEDVTPLLGCEKLERAWLGRNPIPESQWEEVQQGLPGCLFNFTVKDGTGDNWRLHPRHKIKRRIFEGGSYVPWDWAGKK